MNDVRPAARLGWTEVAIVAVFAVAVAVGYLVWLRAAPSVSAPQYVVQAAVAPVTSVSGLIPRRDDRPLFSLDSVVVGSVSYPGGTAKEIPLERSERITFAGWSADRMAGLPNNAVFVAVGTAKTMALTYGGIRSDVATALGNYKLARTGFFGSVSVADLPAGHVAVTFYAVNSTGTAYDEITSPITFLIR